MVKKNTHNSNRILFLISLTLTSAVFAILFFQNINNDENKIVEISNINDIPMINIRRDSLISLLNVYNEKENSMKIDSSNSTSLIITFDNITDPEAFFNYKKNLIVKDYNGFTLNVDYSKLSLICTLPIKKFSNMMGVVIPSDILYSIAKDKAILKN
jgi:hypothetical protein